MIYIDHLFPLYRDGWGVSESSQHNQQLEAKIASFLRHPCVTAHSAIARKNWQGPKISAKAQ